MDPMVIAAASVLVIGSIATAAVSIIKQLQAIHVLVNSAALEAAKKLVTLETTVAALHAQLSALQSQRVVDAQRVSVAQPQTPGAVVEQVVEHQSVERQSIKK